MPDRPRPLPADLEALSAFSAPGPGVTRLAWTPELRAGYDWFAGRCEEAGMAVEIDAAGNLVARWEVGEGPALVVGSHLDTVPSGGRYDGALGVLGGLEAVRLLQAWGVTPTRPIWVVGFMDEENARFNTALFGSRAFCGDDLSDLGDRTDADGVTLRDAMAAWDRTPEGTRAAARIGEVGHYLELHIEQGPGLDLAGAQVGVVTSIVAMTGYRATVTGQANHAGTTPMGARRDALSGAARMVLAIRELGRERPHHTTNVGVMSASPGSSNVIPGTASFTIDLRAPDDDAIAALDADCAARLRAIAAEEGLELELERVYAMEAVPMDPQLADLIASAARDEEASAVAMPSGAGHDAMVLGRHVPTAMVFVPSRDGISHSPDEFTTAEHCELGARILARVLMRLTIPAT